MYVSRRRGAVCGRGRVAHVMGGGTQEVVHIRVCVLVALGLSVMRELTLYSLLFSRWSAAVVHGEDFPWC